MLLCNSRKFRDKKPLRVINKMVVDPATQYFVKCNNNLCCDRIACIRRENGERTLTMPINFAYFIALTMRLPE